MKTIKVHKAQLIEKLRENRETHGAAYREALTGWHTTVMKALLDGRREFDKTENMDNLNFNYKFPRPQDHTQDYSDALEMLDWETEDEILLHEADFRRFVQDDWDWKQGFLASHSQYSVTDHRV